VGAGSKRRRKKKAIPKSKSSPSIRDARGNTSAQGRGCRIGEREGSGAEVEGGRSNNNEGSPRKVAGNGLTRVLSPQKRRRVAGLEEKNRISWTKEKPRGRDKTIA